MYKDIIGLIGGFGAYATLDFYKRILEKFSTCYERDYPHIIIDNNFTMPSRTLALLTGEGKEQIIHDISESLKLLCNAGCTKIILVCGTAHYFLNDCLNIFPPAKEKIVDIIDCTCNQLEVQGINEIVLIAAEGSLSTNLFDNYFNKYDIKFVKPSQVYYNQIRTFIEGVKQNNITKELIINFYSFLNIISNNNTKNIVLGCTEFPVLIDYILKNPSLLPKEDFENFSEFQFWDLTEICLDKLLITLC